MKLPHRQISNPQVQQNFERLEKLIGAPEVTGARDDPESALANLLTVLAAAGLITDSTTAT